ncbi:hypothetical protein H9N25_16775 [Pedobacter riviphilus]|uniref:Uncharacterized protein n=1 Tax=Pedobacter riviphilus TaxID=2766984 RepID=A0ABX6TG29_9SPHI|nr:hypothetical protein [Pedobacter riviphilus]QNR83592.1 hypothetical protein H9N25_16775 [Pedobacter riviphilus]
MGTTIGNILISYDVNKLHTQVKASLELLGYYDNFTNTGESKKYLPNTTLWHPNKSSNQAISDLKTVCNSLGVILEKAVAVRASEFVGI